jgi:hypothetical protein
VVIASFEITQTNQIIPLGAIQQFTARATFSDSSTQDITTSVVWSSSNPKVAAFSNIAGYNGLATSFTAGNTSITASLGDPVVSSSSPVLTVDSSNINNVLPVTVNGGVNGNYTNGPFVSITVCSPGSPSQCTTIPNILLDTGSYGLRIFSTKLPSNLQSITVSSGQLAECIQYADNSADWGPVEIANIYLGNELAANVPIQVIDSTFTGSTSCSNGGYTLDTSPADDGYNGILGVGSFREDCGSGCTSSSNNGRYYSCNGSSCTGTTVSLNNQVQNPVSLLPIDNNGVILRFPDISLGGVSSVNGELILGIDTESNNSSSGVTMYPADPNSANQTYGDFITVFNGQTLSESFIDSGSNGLFFPNTLNLSTDSNDWYTPSTTQSLSATTEGYLGTPIGVVSFQIGDADTLLASSDNVFIELCGTNPSGSFDWGFPFFLGRSVYVGINGQKSKLGTGPYWAY